MGDDMRTRAKLWPKGNLFEEFHEGQTFEHHWGRTITESDTVLFTTLTLSFNPLYFNRVYAKAHGHPDIVVNPHLVFNVVLGLSVEEVKSNSETDFSEWLHVSVVSGEEKLSAGGSVFGAKNLHNCQIAESVQN